MPKNGPFLCPRKVPHRVLYYYFLDRDLGLMHVRLQTWAPFTCQIYVNGHEFLARKLKQRNIPFEQIDNCFTHLQDPKAAQRLADRFAKLPWPKILNKYARQVNPLLAPANSRNWAAITGSAIRPSCHRSVFRQQTRPGRLVFASAGLRLADLHAQENLHLSGPQMARTFRRRSANALSIGA